MDERGYKENLRNMILDMAQKELDSNVSQREYRSTLREMLIK